MNENHRPTFRELAAHTKQKIEEAVTKAVAPLNRNLKTSATTIKQLEDSLSAYKLKVEALRVELAKTNALRKKEEVKFRNAKKVLDASLKEIPTVNGANESTRVRLQRARLQSTKLKSKVKNILATVKAKDATIATLNTKIEAQLEANRRKSEEVDTVKLDAAATVNLIKEELKKVKEELARAKVLKTEYRIKAARKAAKEVRYIEGNSLMGALTYKRPVEDSQEHTLSLNPTSIVKLGMNAAQWVEFQRWRNTYFISEYYLTVMSKVMLDQRLSETTLLPFLLDTYNLSDTSSVALISQQIILRLQGGVDRSFLSALRSLYTMLGHYLKKVRFIT